MAVKTIILTEEQMNRARELFRKKYPWIQRKNGIYSATLVTRWALTIDEKTPCRTFRDSLTGGGGLIAARSLKVTN